MSAGRKSAGFLESVSPESVQMFLNGVKLQYGVNYSIDGVANKNVHYLDAVTVPLKSTDVVEFWYIAY